ncbi:MAG: DUF501 domain-containing protein [Actinomycetota bacterium]
MSDEVVLPATRCPGEEHTRAADEAAVAAQLGRPPRGSWSVARRCPCGHPQVIATDPRLEDGTPFPTMWWLTCARLSSAIGRLESVGWMASFNRRLADEPELREALARSTERYVAMRDRIDRLGPQGHPGGGPGRVKCLHAHVAHQLMSADNPAGAGALAELGWSDPQAPCV